MIDEIINKVDTVVGNEKELKENDVQEGAHGPTL